MPWFAEVEERALTPPDARKALLRGAAREARREAAAEREATRAKTIVNRFERKVFNGLVKKEKEQMDWQTAVEGNILPQLWLAPGEAVWYRAYRKGMTGSDIISHD